MSPIRILLFLKSLCKLTPNPALRAFLKQSLTNRKLLVLGNFKSLVFDLSLSKTGKILVFSQLLSLLLFVQSAQAQHPSVTFLGGANAASSAVTIGGGGLEIEDSYKTLYGMNVGVLYDYVLKKNRSQELSVESGFIFDSKGYHQKPNENQFSDNKTTLYYADIPVYLKYIYRFRSLNKIYFGLGPYLGVGLFGNTNYSFDYPGSEDPVRNSEKIKWGSDAMEDDYKRLDYGLTGKVGFLLDGGFNLTVSYDYGLSDVYTIETAEHKHRVIRLSLGYTIKFDD